ncbi:hypothetical protein HMPREF9554_00242 [Treponema phagedenis F0421]|nr:hypothetical protein HMPREF9554_00242 [Treponema phagedenis F0421]
MSFGFKLLGIKKIFALSEEKLLKTVKKINKHRDFFYPIKKMQFTEIE